MDSSRGRSSWREDQPFRVGLLTERGTDTGDMEGWFRVLSSRGLRWGCDSRSLFVFVNVCWFVCWAVGGFVFVSGGGRFAGSRAGTSTGTWVLGAAIAVAVAVTVAVAVAF